MIQQKKQLLGGGFKDFLNVHPYLGEDSHFDSYFSNGLKPPSRKSVLSILYLWDLFVFFSKELMIYSFTTT